MKKFAKLFLTLALAAAAFTGCEMAQEIIQKPKNLTADKETVKFAAKDAQEETVAIKSDGIWIVNAPEWVKVTPATAKGDQVVVLTASDNVDATGAVQGPRAGKVVFTLVADEKVSATVNIEQEGDNSKDTRHFYTKVSEVTSEKAYLIVATETDGSLVAPILFGPTGTYGYPKSQKVTAEQDVITLEDGESGLIFIAAENGYTIQQTDGRYIWHQSGYNTWSCKEEPDEPYVWTIEKEGDLFKISDNGGYITYGSWDEKNNKRYTTFGCYAALDQTSVYVSLYEDSKAPVINTDKLAASATAVTVAATATSAEFEILSNIEWAAEKTEGEWVKDFTKSGNGSGKFTVLFDANTDSARVAKFTLKGASKSLVLTLTQSAPVSGYTSIADVQAAEIDATTKLSAQPFDVKGTVCGVYARGCMVTDGTGYILYYLNKAVDYKIGDILVIGGYVSAYAGFNQFPANNSAAGVTCEKVGEETFTQPEPVALDGKHFEELLAKIAVEYVQVEGKLVKSGNYYNIFVDGTTTADAAVSISYPLEGAIPNALDGHNIKFKGYTIGISSNKFVNVMLIGEVEDAGEEASIALDKTSAEVSSEGDSFELSVKSVAATWTLSADVDWISFDKTTADSSAVVKVTTAAGDAAEGKIALAAEGLDTVFCAVSRKAIATKPIAEVLKAEGTTAKVAGTVTARDSKGFILTDESGSALVYYASNAKDYAIGTKLSLIATAGSYNNGPQLASPQGEEVESEGTGEYAYPEAVLVDAAAIDEYCTKAAEADYRVETKYVKMVAKLSVSGNYFNLIFEGTEKQGSFYQLHSSLKDAATALNGKEVEAYGYVCSVSKSGGAPKFVNMVLTSIKEYEAPVVAKGVASIAEQIAAGTSTAKASYTTELTNAVVTYVNGNNVYFEDETGGMLYYKSNHGLTAGQTISGTITGQGYLYNGLPEIVSLEGATFGTTETIPCTTLTISQINTEEGNMKYASMRVKIAGVEVKTACNSTNKSGLIADATGEITAYSKGGSLEAAAKGDIICFPSPYSRNGSFSAQINFWEDAHFTKTGGGDVPPAPAGKYDSSISWTLVTTAYDNKATVNGVENVKVLKLGKSKDPKAGSATLNVKAGTKAISFYAVAWKGQTPKLIVNGTVISLKANNGATGNEPYTLTVNDEDFYTVDFGTALTADTDIKIETDTERAIVFAINPA